MLPFVPFPTFVKALSGFKNHTRKIHKGLRNKNKSVEFEFVGLSTSHDEAGKWEWELFRRLCSVMMAISLQLEQR